MGLLKVKIKLLDTYAKVPSRMTDNACGYDVYANNQEPIELKKGSIRDIPLGFAIEIPEGYVGLLCARSSFGRIGLTIPNGLGVIDCDYRGEVRMVLQFNPDPENYLIENTYKIEMSNRVGQLLIVPKPEIKFSVVSDLSPTSRSIRGFGSTGK